MPEKIRYNTLTKIYPDGSQQIIFATKSIFRVPGFQDPVTTGVVTEDLDLDFEGAAQEALDDFVIPDLDDEEIERRHKLSVKRALRRARVKVRDYCLCTHMKYFVTFTLDQTKIDRYDIKIITKKLNQWLNDQNKRKGLSYVMVPELHKDGAVHFHGLITDSLDVADSGTVIRRGKKRPERPKSEAQRRRWLQDGGRIVYNLPSWPYGYTTAMALDDDYERAVNYVCKYISKGIRGDEIEPAKKVGGRWYYSGGDLGEPARTYEDGKAASRLDALGKSAHKVSLDDPIPGVDVYVVWITADGVVK